MSKAVMHKGMIYIACVVLFVTGMPLRQLNAQLSYVRSSTLATPHVGLDPVEFRTRRMQDYVEMHQSVRQWLTEYAKFDILSEEGLNLLQYINQGLSAPFDDKHEQDMRIIYKYFRSIGTADGSYILENFPQAYFRDVDESGLKQYFILIPESRPEGWANLWLRLIDGCPEGCWFCPEHTSCSIRGVMPYPVIVILARAQRKYEIAFQEGYTYEPMFYEDVSGALFADVLKIIKFSGENNLEMHGDVTGQEAVVWRNIKHLGETAIDGLNCVDITVDVMNATFKRMQKGVGNNEDELVKRYVDYYESMIKELDKYHVFVRFKVPPQQIRPEFKRFENISLKIKTELMKRFPLGKVTFYRPTSMEVMHKGGYALITRDETLREDIWAEVISGTRPFQLEDIVINVTVDGQKARANIVAEFQRGFVRASILKGLLNDRDKRTIMKNIFNMGDRRFRTSPDGYYVPLSNYEYQKIIENVFERRHKGLYSKLEEVWEVPSWWYSSKKTKRVRKEKIGAFIEAAIEADLPLPIFNIKHLAQDLAKANVSPEMPTYEVAELFSQSEEPASSADENIIHYRAA